jgi:fibronectin type 3 domain-containing protein
MVALMTMMLLAALPMSAPDVAGSRTLNTFLDGTDSQIIQYTTVPQPGDYTTLYFKLKADVTVVSSSVSMSAIIFEDFHEYTGTGFEALGAALDLSGDINGDGFTDLILTAHSVGANEGIVIGVWGAAGGILLPQDLTVIGANADDLLGWSATAAGDMNHDGYDDVVAGGIQMGFGTPPAATGPGFAEIHWGHPAPNATADRTLTGETDGDMFGFSVSTSGDIDGNGRDDLVVGAPRHVLNTNNPGLAYVYLSGYNGPGADPDTTLEGTDNGDAFGYAVSICGDVNDDGYDDVLVTAPSHNSTTDFDVGKAYLYFGSSSGVGTTPDWTYVGKAQSDLLGYSASGVGDINDDGYDDIVVCAPACDAGSVTNSGEEYVFYGGASGPKNTPDVTIQGSVTNGNLGVSVAPLGDANNDGIGDFAIGEPNVDNGTTTDAGAVDVFFGTTAGISSSPDIVKKGSRANGDYGMTVGRGGDCNNDGYADMTVGDTTLQWTYITYGSGGVKSPVAYLDNTLLMKKDGYLYGTVTSDDMTSLINTYIANHMGDIDSEGYIMIPLNVTFSSIGKMRVHGLNILYYKLNTPTGLAAAPVARGNAITLSWDAQIGDDTTSLALERWNGTGWEEMAKIPRLNVSHTIDGLTDGVEYEFRIKAYDGGVQRYSGPSTSVKVTPRDSLPPAKIINMTYKENRTVMGVNITWNPSDADSVHYEVWSNKSGTWVPIANVSAPDHWYIDTAIEDGPRYYYKVRAWDEVPLSGEFSNVIWAVLQDKTAPAAPSNLQIVPLPEGNGLALSWDLNTDDTVSYTVQSNRTGDWREVGRLGRTGSAFTDRGLVNGVTYYYRVSAIDEANNPSTPSAVIAGVPRDTIPPAVPQGVTVEQRSVGNMLRVLWLPNTDDTERYRVYIYNTTAAEWQAVGDVLASFSQFDVATLVDGQSYRFRVTAIDDAGLESAPSGEASGIPKDTQYPSIPIGIRVMPVPEGMALNVSWASNFDDTVSYKLYRLEAGTWVLVATLPADRTWYLDTGLMNNIPSAYAVTSVDEAGNESPNSERKEGTPIDTVPPARPVFSDLPSKTRFKDVTVAGTCEPLAKVTLHVNKIAMAPVDCDASGHFSTQIRLRSGSNEVYAVADDGSGYTTESARETVFVDETAPGVLQTNPISGETSVEREGLVVEVVFTEDIVPGGLSMVVVKGRQTDPAKILQLIAGGDAIPTTMLSYIRTDLRATFNVSKTLDRSTTYTIVLRGVTDIAGNAMTTEGGLGLYYFSFTTVSTGPVPPTDGGGGGGLSGIVLAGIGVVILIVIVIIVVLFIMRAGAKGETIVLDKDEVIQAPKHELTAEETRPDVKDLYKTAYEERGEPSEHHEVDAGLGTWLAEQEKTRQLAEEDSKRLVQEMAKQPKPPASTGHIEELPPGYVKDVPSEAAEGSEGADGADEPDEENGKGA